VHCSNECDKEQTIKTSNKNGSSFLVLNQDKNAHSSDDDDYKNESGVPSCEDMHFSYIKTYYMGNIPVMYTC